ncbi:MAG: GNAT family N-acetyltransferase [Actinomycetota bacterium]|nr:GNAT family N-acetyltransferase [Actinomycetota bacterium]
MPNPAVTLRPFESHDGPAVLALNNASVPELNELDAPEVARLAGLAVSALVAEVDGVFAGFCWVLGPEQPYDSLNYRWFSSRYDAFVYLDRIAVHPDFRRHGIGRAFYAELVHEFAPSCPVLLCEVNVRPMNEASVRFHQSLGFCEVGRQDTDGGHKTVSLLALELPPR